VGSFAVGATSMTAATWFSLDRRLGPAERHRRPGARPPRRRDGRGSSAPRIDERGGADRPDAGPGLLLEGQAGQAPSSASWRRPSRRASPGQDAVNRGATLRRPRDQGPASRRGAGAAHSCRSARSSPSGPNDRASAVSDTAPSVSGIDSFEPLRSQQHDRPGDQFSLG
jgi:hypothetical protein